MLLSFLCVLALLCQAIPAPAEEVTTTCEECGGAPQDLSWVKVDEANHAQACPHGVIKADTVSEHCFALNSDQEGHWNECSVCHVAGDGTSHWDICTNPGVCAECSAKGVAITWTQHADVSQQEWQHDGGTHWKPFPACQSRVDEENHRFTADSPVQCEECGAADGQPFCEQCGGAAKMTYVDDGEGAHVMKCPTVWPANPQGIRRPGQKPNLSAIRNTPSSVPVGYICPLPGITPIALRPPSARAAARRTSPWAI